MKHSSTSPRISRLTRTLGCCLALSVLTNQSPAALTDLATSPLETSTSSLVKPNILFILDDSGSMTWDFLPDWAYTTTEGLARNSGYNGIYYNPAITYTPPMKYDGSSYPSMTAANTTSWTKVPYDGYGVQTPSNIPNTGTDNLFTDSSSGTTQDLSGGKAFYYTFIAGEYCNSPNLRNCVTASSSGAVAGYTYPALLRWCSTSARTNCRATRIDTAPSGGSTYTYARYPGMTSPSVPGSNNKISIVSGKTYPYPGTTTRVPARSDCTAPDYGPCTYTEEMTNYANWWAYYRMRMQMAKSAASLAFSVLDSRRRLGYMSINNNTGTDFLNVSDLTTGSTGQKALWYAKIVAAKPNNSTPLRTSLATAGRYYAGKLSKVNTVTATDPMQYSCQRNYTVLSTDGYWNESTTPTQIDGSTAIGDQDSATTIDRPYYDGTATGNTLADVAQYYYATDIRSTALSNANGVLGTDVANNAPPEGQQRMYTSTVGLGASGYMQFQSNYASATTGDYYDVKQGTTTSATTASNGVCSWQTSGKCNWPKAASNTQTTIDDLWHAAVNGRGLYYSASNPEDLKSGLKAFLDNVSGVTSDAAAATTSNPNVSNGDNFVFKSTFHSQDWYGEMARYTIDVNEGKLSTSADWSQSGTTKSADGKDSPALTDLLVPSSRNIYTYDPSSATPLLPFQWASMSTTLQNYFKVAAIGTLSQMCASGTECLSATDKVDSTAAGTKGVGGYNLVSFLRGDRSNEGADNDTLYRQRTHVLGDIVDSQAVYVRSPMFTYLDTGYTAFRTDNTSRQPMLYVGANDGMLHAFNATTGAETWAYIPSMLVPKLYKLADKFYASNHVFYVNATPRQGDVYFDGAWHTVLIGGLGAGGRGFYALDITSPLSPPKVLWEFTYDTTKTSGYTVDADLGYSFGSPVITKLSDGTWVAIVTSGYNNVSPGTGHGIVWVLNVKTGAIIKKIDTGAGGTTTVAGCSTAPCPAGLTKLSAYVDSGANNNQAKRLYGGDMLGNVWRIDISALTAAGGNAPVQLLATLADANNVRQPVTARPEVGNVDGTTVIFVGTGAYLGVADVSNTTVQSIYGIKDPLTSSGSASGLYASPRGSTCTSSTKTNCFVKQNFLDTGKVRNATSSVSYAVDFTTMNGWYADLPESGERMNTDPDLQLGTLAFTSNIPSSSTACSVGGVSYLNYVDYKTGLGVANSSVVGTQLSNGPTTALATAPTLVRLPNSKVIAIVNLADGSTVTEGVNVDPKPKSARRVSWRELINGN